MWSIGAGKLVREYQAAAGIAKIILKAVSQHTGYAIGLQVRVAYVYDGHAAFVRLPDVGQFAVESIQFAGPGYGVIFIFYKAVVSRQCRQPLASIDLRTGQNRQ